MKTRYCDECRHFNDEDLKGAKVCYKGYKPKWYSQKNDSPYDLDYGYKRKCEDFEEITK